jgi:hypothetical protein
LNIHLITEPKRYIHAYATQTPASTLLEENNRAPAQPQIQQDNGTVNRMMRATNGSGVGQTTTNFSKELRDQGKKNIDSEHWK